VVEAGAADCCCPDVALGSVTAAAPCKARMCVCRENAVVQYSLRLTDAWSHGTLPRGKQIQACPLTFTAGLPGQARRAGGQQRRGPLAPEDPRRGQAGGRPPRAGRHGAGRGAGAEAAPGGGQGPAGVEGRWRCFLHAFEPHAMAAAYDERAAALHMWLLSQRCHLSESTLHESI
jgi:hypothetical protein